MKLDGAALVFASCTGTVITAGEVVHAAPSCPIHPEVEAYTRGVEAGRRVQFQEMLDALGDPVGNSEEYKTWYYSQESLPPGYLGRFERYLARTYLEQATRP